MADFIIDFSNEIINFYIIVTILIQKFKNLEIFIKKLKNITNFIFNKTILQYFKNCFYK
jgi:hypothetical protein